MEHSMKYVAILVMVLCVSCKKNHCPDADAGASLPCVGKADGVECCMGAKVGTCKAQECIVP